MLGSRFAQANNDTCLELTCLKKTNEPAWRSDLCSLDIYLFLDGRKPTAETLSRPWFRNLAGGRLCAFLSPTLWERGGNGRQAAYLITTRAHHLSDVAVRTNKNTPMMLSLEGEIQQQKKQANGLEGGLLCNTMLPAYWLAICTDI